MGPGCWGSSPHVETTLPGDGAGRVPGRRAGAARLAWALAGALPDQSVPGASEPVHLWAPTLKGVPIPSSPVIADVYPTKGAAPELAPWIVTALRLPP